jgi:hypothetical protein
MTDAFSDYVMLMSDIEQIPEEARESLEFSTQQRAETIARVVDLVRDRVLPQSDREEASLEALLGGGRTTFGRAPAACGATDHDAILVPVEELTHADPRDGTRVQELLYRIHAALAGHFAEAELILASAAVEGRPPTRDSSLRESGREAGERSLQGHTGASTWFG